MEEEGPLGVRNAKRMSIDLRIDVTIGNPNIRPAIVVEIEKLGAKTKERDAYRSNIRRTCQVGELAMVIVVVEVVGIVGEIGLEDVRPSIAIIVGGVDPHASLLAAIGAIRDTSFGAYFLESAFAIVMVEKTG